MGGAPIPTWDPIGVEPWPNGCGSKIGAPNGTLVSGNMDQNLRSPGGLILTHGGFLERFGSLGSEWGR